MAFDVQLVDSAVEDFNALDARWRSTVRAAMESILPHEPRKESRSRVKRLRGVRSPQYRLRVDEYRVFYDVNGEVVTVLAIVAKSSADAWLKANAEMDDD